MIKLEPIKQDEKIAIAIPTKNRHSYLSALLSSLVQQSYVNWMLVINDSSKPCVEENDTLKDLFSLIRNKGHDVKITYTHSGWDRHQKAMEAVPEQIEFIIRIDDDLLLEPDFIKKILKPFYFFKDRPIVAVGGCYPETFYKTQNLDVRLIDPSWVSRIDSPSWKLQGHHYQEKQILEVESLLGHAICYRRSVVKEVGGWAVKGYSDQAHREESDLCARLKAGGYELMVSTEAIGWHLYSPSGGSRLVKKTPRGNFLVSDKQPLEEDDRLFTERVGCLLDKSNFTHKELKRYRVSDLEKGVYKDCPFFSLRGKLLIPLNKRIPYFLRRIRGIAQDLFLKQNT